MSQDVKKDRETMADIASDLVAHDLYGSRTKSSCC
jgi:hypothetical protein